MKYLIIPLILVLFSPIVLAQNVTLTNSAFSNVLNASGGEGSGEGGSISYSIGQIFYTTIKTSEQVVFQGIQLPRLKNTEPVITTSKPALISVQAYPNPATDYFIINVDNYDKEDLHYEFSNFQGKLIESREITNQKTKVNSTNLQAAVYLLRIYYRSTPIKTLKIIKR